MLKCRTKFENLEEIALRLFPILLSIFLQCPSNCSPFNCRKCFYAAYYYLDDPPNHPQTMLIDWQAPSMLGGEKREAVHVEEFTKHVAQLHADGDIGFSREYELIQTESINEEHASEHSQHPDNKGKNRYLNIIACKSDCLILDEKPLIKIPSRRSLSRPLTSRAWTEERCRVHQCQLH